MTRSHSHFSRAHFSRAHIALALLAASLLACSARLALAQQAVEKLETVATVNDSPVYASEVEREVAKVVKGREVEPSALLLLRAEALDRLISRRLILQYLSAKSLAASDADLTLAVQQARDRLKQQALTLEQFIERGKLTMDEFTRTLEWQLSWQKYLEANVTEKTLEMHFDRFRPHFDGTQIRVSQLLLKIDAQAAREKWDAAQTQAAEIRAEIAAGTISFSDAAKKHSQAPSGPSGGDIGLISRHEPMPEKFSKTAFDLKRGEVSQPVTTTFGVHLVMCVDVQPGQKTWQDVRQELEADLVRYLFDSVANQQRPNAVIKFHGQTPHFKPGTRDVDD